MLENSHHPAPYKAEGLRQRLLPFIQSPTVPGSPYQPTFPFSPILQRGTVRLRGWGGVGGRHPPSQVLGLRPLNLLGDALCLSTEQQAQERAGQGQGPGGGRPSPPCICPWVPQLHFCLPGARLAAGFDLSCAVTLSWMPSSLYARRQAHTSTLSGSPWERRQESPVVQTDSTASSLDSPHHHRQAGADMLGLPLPPQTWYRVDAL